MLPSPGSSSGSLAEDASPAARGADALTDIRWGAPLPERVGRPEVVRQLLQTALAANPQRAELHLKLAHTHLDQLDYRSAAAHLERAVALDGLGRESRLLLARCYNTLKRPEATLQVLEPVDGCHVERAAALLQLADPAAEPELREVLARNPNQVHACRLLCRLLRRSGRHQELLVLCETLFAAGGSSAQLLYNWGVALALTGNVDRARRLMFDPVHISRIALPVPEGFSDIAAFNDALAAEILANPNAISEFPDEVEANRGSRRIDNLFHGRRADLIECLVQSFQQLSTEYRVVRRDGFDPWPSLRPTAARLRPWGLLQRNDAYEAGHIHPLGWLSGVYYVRVPQAISRAADGAGSLAFGPPRSAQIGLAPTSRYVPKEGVLLLAPSHYEHWTIPSRVDEERISIAFDLVPERNGYTRV